LPDSVSFSQDSGDRAKNIVQGVGYLTVQYLATSVLGFVFLFAVIRIVPTFQYGIYSAVSVTVAIASTIALIGLNLGAARFVSFRSEESWDAAKKTVLLSLLLTGVTTAFYCALSPVFSLYFARSAGWTWAFFLGGGWIFTSSIASTLQGVLQGMKKYATIAKILFLSRFAIVAVTLVLLFVERTIEFPLISWSAYYGAIALWIFLTIQRPIRDAKSGTLRYTTIIRYSIPLGIAAIITAFSSYSDSVVVGGYLNASSLGVYQAAVQASTVLGIIAVTPLTTALFPEISGSRTGGDISNGVRLAFRFISLAVLPASLLVAALSVQLLDLFTSGGVYLTGALTLELIGLFYVFVAMQMVLLILLQAVGKTFEVIIVGIVAASTDLLVALVLVPHFGLAGAVTSKVAVSLDGAAVAIYICRGFMRAMDSWSFYVKAAVSSLVPFVLILALSHYFSSKLLTLLPYGLVFSVIYLVCIRQLKVLSLEDRNYLIHILPGRLQKLAALL
jgi:O-antigen/teichoic acid export membrane protein